MARNYAKEYANYQGKPEQIANRSNRNKARRAMVAKGVDVRGKDVDHKTPIAKGGGNGSGNLRAVSPSANRSFPRTSGARMK